LPRALRAGRNVTPKTGQTAWQNPHREQRRTSCRNFFSNRCIRFPFPGTAEPGPFAQFFQDRASLLSLTTQGVDGLSSRAGPGICCLPGFQPSQAIRPFTPPKAATSRLASISQPHRLLRHSVPRNDNALDEFNIPHGGKKWLARPTGDAHEGFEAGCRRRKTSGSLKNRSGKIAQPP